jgi:hypothetical protein
VLLLFALAASQDLGKLPRYCSCAEVWHLILQERLFLGFHGNFIMEKCLALWEERIYFKCSWQSFSMTIKY